MSAGSRPLLIGSRAAASRVRWPRRPKDWDVVAFANEIHVPHARMQPGARSDKQYFQLPGSRLEVFIADGSPFYGALRRLPASDDLTVDVPLLGSCAVASLETLFVLKQVFVAYSVHFYKTLADYHTLKGLIGPLSQDLVSLAVLGYAHARERHATLLADCARRPETCAFGHHEGRNAAGWRAHAALHEKLSLRASGEPWTPGWATQALGSEALGPDRARLVRLLAEETAVIAHEQARGEIGEAGAFGYARRLLATRLLPLGWRYFMADAWPEIAALER